MDSNSSEDSSSDYSTESSDDDGMETAQINGIKVQLPQGLCERSEIFQELFSADLWNSFSEHNKQHLQTFLPNFPENDDLEKSKTLQRLFDFEVFRFNSPLEKFHEDLKAGYFRPDIARMRKIINKAQKKEARYRYRSYREVLKQEVIESQRKLLNQIKNLPPGVEPKPEKRKLNIEYLPHRTKRRYFQILSQIKAKVDDNNCSSDENYPEGPPQPLSRKQKRHLNSIKNSLSSSRDKIMIPTMTMKLNSTTNCDLEKFITPTHNPFYINEESYKYLINQHKRQKMESPDDPEFNTKGITVSEIVHRTQLPYIKSISSHPPKHHHDNKLSHKKRFKARQSPDCKRSSESDSDSIEAIAVTPKPKIRNNNKPPKSTPAPNKQPIKSEVVVKKEPEAIKLETPPTVVTPTLPPPMTMMTPEKVTDLDGIDIMNLPIDLDNSDIDILSEFTSKPELMQNTHANFFSLIKDVICSTSEHRMNMYTLQEQLKSWQENPISPLNDWYNLADNWISLLPSAITFLCGNSSEQPDDFVPYMEYKTQVDMYQWIGAGRDSDSLLSCLCQFWLEHRTETKTVSPFKEKEDFDMELTERSGSPPPPRCPTNWTVRKATPEEVKDFQEQERKRYENPHKAFTYRCNGYESIVGPLKGIYNAAMGNAKARGHTMLTADRPNFVTILSLVRDATARLPNGEGTRAEICELLKSSQYIAPNAADNLLQSVVSGALDRMHTQFDPCVKYDPKRKIWIYLHRNRTEEDFERIHQQFQGVNKKKTSAKKSPAKPKIKEKPIKPAKVETTMPMEGKPKVIRRPSAPAKIVTTVVVTNATTPPLLTVTSQKTASLLITNSNTKQDTSQSINQAKPLKLQEDKEISSFQAIVQSRTASPTLKGTKSVVKILSPSQGKSLIIPTSNAQIIKQIQESSTQTKQVNQQIITQQLLQTLAQQKPILVKQNSSESGERTEQKIKVSPTVQQHIIQSITPQQLQNIKNVTLLRTSSGNTNLSPITVSSQSDSQNNIVTVSVSKQTSQANQIYGPGIQIKTQGNLTQSQQQQILQTIRHKFLPQGVIQQPVVYKQKTIKTGGTTTSVAQVKTASETTTKTQAPVVAKVLTNAAGQVISVESLLAHQKQHGQLPQGTTLRVAGAKAGQQNIIHLTGSSKANNITQYAVGAQNNLIAITTQPKLIVSSQTTTVTSTLTSTKPIARTVTKPQTVTKFTPKVTQQLINAKIITQNADGQKIVQPKIVMSQQGHVKLASGKSVPLSKPVTLNVAGNANTIRMVNAANLNLTHIGGKPVLLASKGGTIQNIQGQNVILQAQPNSSGASLVLQQNTVKTSNNTVQQTSSNNINIINQQNFVLGPQVKVQQPQVVLSAGGVKTVASSNAQQTITQGHIMLGGQPVRLQTSNATSTQRLVLASQGQGGQIVAQQILLPTGFQGTAINLKALQGVKVIPIAQSQGKGLPGRQVFARVMNPSLVKTTQPTANQDKTAADKPPPTPTE